MNECKDSKPHHSHLHKHITWQRQKHTKSCQRKTAATESAIPWKKKKKKRCCINPQVASRHNTDTKIKVDRQKVTRGKGHTYHKHCHQFLYKHNPYPPMWFPRSSVQSSGEYLLKQTTCISRFNYLHGEVALGVCVCVFV